MSPVLLPLLALGLPLGAQQPDGGPRVVEARIEARVDSTGEGVRVEVDYRLRPEGEDSIPLQALEFFGTAVRDVETRSGPSASARPVALRRSPSGSLVGALPVPGPGASEIRVTIAYTVRGGAPGAGRFDVTLPVVMVDWSPVGAREELFTARVDLPSDYAVVEAFPMVPRGVAEAGAYRAHSVSLPVVPSMLRFRGRIGTAPLFTLERLVDLGVGVVLLLLALGGWRGLRRSEAARRRGAARPAGDSA